MTHVVQFTTLPDLITDLTAGQVAAVYHDLHEQRISHSPQYGLSTWLLVTVVRALVTHDRVVHAATLTIPHGRAVERVNGRIFGPPGSDEADADRWQAAQAEHHRIIDHLQWRLSQHGLLNTARPGILNVPGDLPLICAANPLKLIESGIIDAAAEYNPGGNGSQD